MVEAKKVKRSVRLGHAGKYRKVVLEMPADEPEMWDARSKLEVVGRELPRIDGPAKSSGQATYTHDIRLPGMLYAAVLRSPHASATIKSVGLDAAARAEGVKAVLAVAKPGERMIFAGHDVAAVAATSPALARAALDAIEVEYEIHHHVVDIDAALAPGAVRVHKAAVEERRTAGDEPGTASAGKISGNLRPLPTFSTGSIEAGLKSADVVHEAEYDTPVILHSALETHGLVVRWDGPSAMTVWCSTQGIFSVRADMADIFNLSPGDVLVVTDYMGGGFGAKFGAGAPGSRLGFIAGTLARKAGVPVQLMCTRRDEQTATGNRPNSRQKIRLGATSSGRLTAIDVVAHGTAGIGTGAGIGRNASHIYSRCANRSVVSHDVFTHAGPGTAMRAPGHPQGAFALELAIDELAASIERDPLQMRIDHDEHPVRLQQYELGAKAIDWRSGREASRQRRQANARVRTGLGVAASIWGDFGRAKVALATVNIYRRGVVEVVNGVQDLGTGIATVMAQITAEVFRRPVGEIQVKWGRSDMGRSVGSGGSMTTASVAPAVRKAAELARAELLELAAKKLGVRSRKLDYGANGEVSAGDRKLDFAALCRLVDDEPLSVSASRPETFAGHPMNFMGSNRYQMAGVQFAAVEVDTWTGEVAVKRIVAVHDPGRVMNELTLRSQINGGIMMGLGMALCEERCIDRRSGRVLNADLEGYKLAGFGDLPDIEVLITEVHTGANNTGCVGIGEPATIPTAAAVANAVFDALGSPVRRLPLIPARVLAALDGAPAT